MAQEPTGFPDAADKIPISLLVTAAHPVSVSSHDTGDGCIAEQSLDRLDEFHDEIRFTTIEIINDDSDPIVDFLNGLVMRSCERAKDVPTRLQKIARGSRRAKSRRTAGGGESA